MHLDPWQQHVIRGALGERSDGNWQAFEVGLIVPRQNGKGAIIEALELFWLFLCDEDRLILHSAHEFKTAREGFLRIRGLIEATPDLRELVRQFYASTGGECGVELLDGKRLRFVARSTGAGRGFSPDKLVLDEAYHLPESAIEAVLPSVGARPNPQVWYTSSPGDWTIAPCDVLGRVRRRGIRGVDDALAFFEWSVPYDESGRIDGDPGDPKLWAIANPSLGIRKTAERVANFHQSMSAAGFAREELGVGNWPRDLDMSSAFGPGAWQACRSDAVPSAPPGAIGVAVSFDRAWSSIAAATAGEIPHVGASFAEDGTVDRRPGTDWLVPRVAEIALRHGCVAVVDSKGPAGSLVGDLEEAGVRVITTSTDEYIGACARIFDTVQASALTHDNSDALNDAVGAAEKRKVGDRWAWARRSGDISMLEAATLAHYGASNASPYDVLDSFY